MDRPANAVSTVSGFLQQQVSLCLRASEILAFLLLAQTCWLAGTYASNSLSADFFTVWSVPHVLSLRPKANVYSREGQQEIASVVATEAQSPNASDLQRKTTALCVDILYSGRIDVIATPFLYTAMGWLSSGNYLADQKRFVFLSTLCLFLSMMVLKGLLRFSAVEIFLLTIFIASEYGPVLSDFGVGNINEIQFFGIMLFILFWVRAKPLLAGLAIGSTTMLKPTTAIVFVLSMIAGLADRDFRQLLRVLFGCLIAVGASLVASMAFFRNPAIWLDWARSLHETLSGVRYPLQDGNFSLFALLFGPTDRSPAIILLALLFAFSWLLFATGRNGTKKLPSVTGSETDGPARRMHTAFAVGGGGCAIMLLSSPYVWLHYYILLLPLLLYLMRPALETQDAISPGPIRSIGASVLPFVLLLMFSVPTQMIIGDRPRLLCTLFILATITSLSVASYRIWQQRSAVSVNPTQEGHSELTSLSSR